VGLEPASKLSKKALKDVHRGRWANLLGRNEMILKLKIAKLGGLRASKQSKAKLYREVRS
jgi:hypothetical protein